MVRVITQETFDDVVRENVEELDMTEEEALSAAAEQFKTQGVDLSNIMMDTGSKEVFSKALTSLKSSIEEKPEKLDGVVDHLAVIRTESCKGTSYRVLANKLGAYTILLDVLTIFYDNKQVQVAALYALTELMTGYPDLLDSRGTDVLMKCVKDKGFTEDVDTLCAALKWSHQCCIKDEKNRQVPVPAGTKELSLQSTCGDSLLFIGTFLLPTLNPRQQAGSDDSVATVLLFLIVQYIERALIQRGLSDIVTDLFNKVCQADLPSSSPEYESAIKVLAETCELVRVLILDDDIREAVSRGHEHARCLAISNLSHLVELLQKVKEDPKAASLVVGTLSNLVVRNEFCETVDDAGGLEHIWSVAVNFPDDERLNIQCLRLLKGLAGNDQVKAHIVEKGFITLIISAMRRYEKGQKVQSAACNAIAALALRNPAACQLFVDNGAPEAIVQAMKQHANVGSVQRPCCLAIRNIVARSKELSAEFLKLGVEELLNQIDKKQGGDEAKAALRDLGCYVKFAEPFTGEVGNKLAK